MRRHGHTLTPKSCVLLRRVPGHLQRPPRVSVRWGRQVLLKNCELHLAGAPHRCRGLVTHGSGSGSVQFMPDRGRPTREGLRVARQVGEPIAARSAWCQGCPVQPRGPLGGPQQHREPRTSGSTAAHACRSGESPGELSHLWSPGRSHAAGARLRRSPHNCSAQFGGPRVLRLSLWAPTCLHWRLTWGVGASHTTLLR